MAQSLLYNAFGGKGVTYRSAKVLGNGLIFCVETTNHHGSRRNLWIPP